MPLYNPSSVNLHSPGPIGDVTPSTGAFATTFTARGALASVNFGDPTNRTSGVTFQSQDGDVQIFDRRIEFNASTGFFNLNQSTVDFSNGTFILTSNNIKMPTLPTSDPHVVGVLWSNLGIVTVSAG